MSDYTQTPNLSLYKPNFDADIDQWGFHLNSNADVLDALLATGAGGAFLPLAGGTMTGLLTVPRLNLSNIPHAQPDGSPPIGAVAGDVYNNGGFLCIK